LHAEAEEANLNSMVKKKVLLFGLSGLSFVFLTALADLKPEKIHMAEAKKTGFYIKDGMFTGGDKSIQDTVVRDIRRGPNKGFERVVIELSGNMGGENQSLQRPPYYQVAVSPEESRLAFTIWGNPKVDFDTKKMVSKFKSSVVIQNVSLFPKLEKENWTFVFEMKPGHPVEVFELSNPARIIVDIKTSGAPKNL
jgi:hypothetical protein